MLSTMMLNLFALGVAQNESGAFLRGVVPTYARLHATIILNAVVLITQYTSCAIFIFYHKLDILCPESYIGVFIWG